MGRQSTITVNIFILQVFILVGYSAGAAEVEVQGPKSVVVSPIAVHVNDQTNTAVAYGTALDEYLVVYEHEYSVTDHNIYGRRVGSDGVPIANEIGIFTDANSDFDPAVTYNTLTDEFLVVWNTSTRQPITTSMAGDWPGTAAWSVRRMSARCRPRSSTHAPCTIP